jgi:hypothetical protein
VLAKERKAILFGKERKTMGVRALPLANENTFALLSLSFIKGQKLSTYSYI